MISIHLALTVKVQLLFTRPRNACILLDMIEDNIFISKVRAPFEISLHTHSEK